MVGVKLHIHGTIASDGGPKKIKGANSSMKEILSMQITKMHTNSFMWNVLKFFEYHTIVRSFLYLFTEGVLKISLYSVFPSHKGHGDGRSRADHVAVLLLSFIFSP